MIEGLDSSFDEPTLEQARQAYAAGVRAWGGYFGSRDGLGLAVRWNRMSFWNVQQAGMRAIGFCSGWDDPDWIRRTAAEWDILACADVEFGIREDGDWVDDWVARAASGLYGNTSVHYRAGRPPGRGAAFNVAAWYFKVPPECWDPQMTWPWWLPATGRPTGWQFCGTHDEFGLSVDRSWLDDWFAPALTSNPIGGDMTPEEHQTLSDINVRTAELYNYLRYGADSAGNHEYDRDRLAELTAAVQALPATTANLQPVLDAIAALKADLDGLTLRKA